MDTSNKDSDINIINNDDVKIDINNDKNHEIEEYRLTKEHKLKLFNNTSLTQLNQENINDTMISSKLSPILSRIRVNNISPQRFQSITNPQIPNILSTIDNNNDTNGRVTYKTISNILDNTYNYEETISSTALDILAVYLKGQKILYIEAKTYCEQRLNFLMLPAIFISAICAVLSLQLKTYENGAIIIASLNGFNSFILSLISYLKLDAKAEAHKAASYKFDKLQSLCEFNSGKVLFFENNPNHILDILNEIETIVKEIKETNQFILPETIRYRYHKLYSTNIFSLVKKIQNDEIVLVNELKNIINKIIDKSKQTQTIEIKQEIVLLEIAQNNKLSDIIKFRNKYLDIDKEFNDEINLHIENSKSQFNCCSWLNT